MFCWIAVIFFTSKPAVFAASAGVGTFFLIIGFRRVGASPTMGLLLAIAALGALILLIAPELLARALDLALWVKRRLQPGLARTHAAHRCRYRLAWVWSGHIPGTTSDLSTSWRSSYRPRCPYDGGWPFDRPWRPSPLDERDQLSGWIMWLLIGALQRGRIPFSRPPEPAAVVPSSSMLQLQPQR